MHYLPLLSQLLRLCVIVHITSENLCLANEGGKVIRKFKISVKHCYVLNIKKTSKLCSSLLLPQSRYIITSQVSQLNRNVKISAITYLIIITHCHYIFILRFDYTKFNHKSTKVNKMYLLCL